ncbi:MAG: tyrosine-type recombinase/integrase [Lachnospiraceae bacterium]|nr:tyrosine-type recombinase/integrase [Lachnospiraceae bacterium]
MSETYNEQVNNKNILKLRELLAGLPPFCKDFFRGITDTTSSRTRIAYAYDLHIFFAFLHETNGVYRKMDIVDFPLSILEQLTREDIVEYSEYLSLYINSEGKQVTNDERGKTRKLASLRTFYNFYFQNEYIKNNPAVLVPLPKQHQKEIIRLEANEVATLLDQVEDGTKLTRTQTKYHQKTKIRDLALLTLLLGTGIRVSECVGLDLNDVDFNTNGIKIHRKGGYETIVYFGDEVETALHDYLEERHHVIPVTGHENALFLSMQNKRISVRAVEKLVKKYAGLVTNIKKITPHKLRSTYGTSLYQETGDIYLVADVLGHRDVNTTKKHYAAIEDANRRKAAKVVKLREEYNKNKE